MTWTRVLLLLAGLALFALVLSRVDLSQVAASLVDLGPAGALAVFLLYLLNTIFGAGSWLMAVPTAVPRPDWLRRLWVVRTAGEAFNVMLPTTLGGEPLKAWLLKKRHGVDYREGGASLVIAKTTSLLSLIVFSAVGLGIALADDTLPRGYAIAAAAGLAALSAGVLGFFAVQRWRLASRLGRLLVQFRLGRPLARFLDSIEAVDDLFHAFYAGRPGRFAASVGLALLQWGLGVVEVYLVLKLLGHPIGWGEAWMLEALIQLVRAGTFLIPGSLGASELTFVAVVELLTGQPSLGLAVALIRRGRELLWILWGLALGWRHASLRPPGVAETLDGR